MSAQIAGITLPILVIVLIGFFHARSVKPDLAGANRLVVDIALPLLIFTSLSTKAFEAQTALWFAGGSVLLIALSGLIAWPLSRLAGLSPRAFLPCVMFANVGPVGIPLTVLAYGPQGLAPALILLVLSNLLHFSLGTGLMSGRVEWRMVYANPLVWSTLLGLAFSMVGLRLPEWLGTPLTMIGSVLVPMMLLSLGARLAVAQIGDAHVGVTGAVLAMVARLMACGLVLSVVPLQGVERGALILFACLPPAVFNFLLADRFHVEPGKVASMVIVGHLTGLAFLPLGIWLAFL
ncbi:AEC family transporter [Hydrogenophaga sp.]|uniref:AEC family transporter n=1 Tax=Hydrogenophaga sp. TaxID=1904254 RepID=UPI002FC70739